MPDKRRWVFFILISVKRMAPKKKMKREDSKGQVVLYKNQLEVHLAEETVWLRQEQIASLFGTQRPAITKHLSNIFKTKELDRDSVSSILEHTAANGKVYKTKFYNLDAIISVGYRVNSNQATQFRIWATNVLRQHLVEGYTLNKKRLMAQEEKIQTLQEAVRLSGNVALLENVPDEARLSGSNFIVRRSDNYPCNISTGRYNMHQRL